jgi:hypothetical protein
MRARKAFIASRPGYSLSDPSGLKTPDPDRADAANIGCVGEP